jgi:cyclophilin family peptidyl-prolyl cis-trans isomerase
MGKAEKLKEQRKIEKIRQQLAKERKLRTTSYVIMGTLVGIILGSAVYFGVIFVKDKYFPSEKTIEATSYKTGDKVYSRAPEMQIDVDKTYVAKFETNRGNFEAELYSKDAPKTVNNFVVLSRDGFYDGLTFHRVINDFMIQGGDPNGDGTGDPGYKFEDEINIHKLEKGILAMANSGVDTNGSQFFIVTKDATDWLDGKHTAFGRIVSGLENVMKIQELPVGENDKPIDSVIINKITIEEK